MLSDIFAMFEYTKEKRKVTGLRFIIRKNPQLKLNMAEPRNHVAVPGVTGQHGWFPGKNAIFRTRRMAPANG
jgi:hypothetical protein